MTTMAIQLKASQVLLKVPESIKIQVYREKQ